MIERSQIIDRGLIRKQDQVKSRQSGPHYTRRQTAERNDTHTRNRNDPIKIGTEKEDKSRKLRQINGSQKEGIDHVTI